MAQNVLDYTYDPTGNELMDEYLPKMAENCLTNNSGSTRPTYAVENTVWVDTSDNNIWRYKIYDGTSDIVLFELDNITKKITFPNISGVFRFKGSVATVSALPATGNLPGDVYNVVDGGANYAWNGSEWDKLSENLEWGRIVGTLSNQTDLQNALNAKYDSSNPDGYQTASDVATAISGKQDTLVSGTNIKTINGSSVLGSGDLSVTAQIVWGSITGTLSNQADLQNALNAKANDSAVVKLSGNQTIAGVKTFLDLLCFKNGGTYSATPASIQMYGNIRFKDSTGKDTGVIDNYTTTDGTTHIRLYAYLPTDISKYSIIDLSVDKYGNWNTYVPTPATSSNSNQIATTAFVKNQGYVPSSSLSTVHVVIETYKNGTSWYRVYDDGWVEQGGFTTGSNNAFATVTFLKAFSDTNYTILCTQEGTTNADRFAQYKDKTTTSVGLYRDDYGTGIAWYACGQGA